MLRYRPIIDKRNIDLVGRIILGLSIVESNEMFFERFLVTRTERKNIWKMKHIYSMDINVFS